MQDDFTQILAPLANALPCGYSAQTQPATETTALAAMALLAYGQSDAARRGLEWLVTCQQPDGSLGINETEATPCWTTALAVLAWTLERRVSGNAAAYTIPRNRALRWLLKAIGKPQPRTPEMGHDSTLVGWPWVIGTHSWLEPTAWSVLALRAAGHPQHERTREAVQLLVDRLLPAGGCNYGNTLVLGQHLRPHLAPTGLVLVALAGESVHDPRLPASLEYLERELSGRTSCISLCYGLLGLAAHDRFPAAAGDWLRAAAQRVEDRGPDWKRALVALAALGPQCPLIPRNISPS